jgi:hypothetical protein
MKTKQLGNSDLEVSVVGVGCMMFGSMCDQDTTTAVIDAALEFTEHHRAHRNNTSAKRWAPAVKILFSRQSSALNRVAAAGVRKVAAHATTS